MLLITCPYCQKIRPEIEFAYAGEAHIVRPDATLQAKMDDQAWAEFLFIRQNTRGLHYERWWHNQGCNRFFNAVRDTFRDQFVMTYKIGRRPPTPAQIAAVHND